MKPPPIMACGWTAVVCLVAAGAAAAEPVLEKTDLFTGGEGGYTVYRIPGIVVTAKGTLLAYCEARRGSSDWGASDILLRRSPDGGKTWEPARKLVEAPRVDKNPVAVAQKLGKDGDVTVNNPVAIADNKTSAVHCFYCVEYNRCFYLQSDDDGRTFSEPADITAAFDEFRPEYDWKVCATGPGHGIQLSSGRLLVPVWLSTGTGGGGHRPSAVSTIYSDDAGKTWHRGAVVAAHPDPLANPSETAAVQLADGRVMLNLRHESEPHLRAVTTSPDGARGWSPIRLDPQLPEPVCMASLVRLSGKGTGNPAADRNRIVFANPHNPSGRERRNLTIKLSYDEANTWPVAKSLEPGLAGYCDLAAGSDGTIYCFYERGGQEKNGLKGRRLTLARFSLEWLTDGKDRWK